MNCPNLQTLDCHSNPSLLATFLVVFTLQRRTLDLPGPPFYSSDGRRARKPITQLHRVISGFTKYLCTHEHISPLKNTVKCKLHTPLLGPATLSSMLEVLQLVLEPWSESPCCPSHGHLWSDSRKTLGQCRWSPRSPPAAAQTVAGLFLLVS